uniref:Uncharacterized protein n=1 Tax=uncultured marine thaumarchaeote AD1000_49_H01 TaxID=1455922 RepID=A0A075FYK5_9ARCH|nr:hypothetical protein [uncultured marine thaumarchaeote AD1000_49_H01]
MNGGIYHLNTDITKILPVKGSIEGIVFPKLVKKFIEHSKIQECIVAFYRFSQGC